MTAQYDTDFYDIINAGSRASAQIIVPVVLELTGAKTVIDVGCGEGAWAQVFEEHGCDVMGVDGNYVDRKRLLIQNFIPADIQHERVSTGGVRRDLAVSLEVAEHLAERRAATFVEDLCKLGKVVMFSAAVPGQGGVGHVNEQWPEYWAELFADQGYEVTGALRWLFWDDAREGKVENWYAQNLLLAAHPSTITHRPELAEWFEHPGARPFAVVHPVLWDSRR